MKTNFSLLFYLKKPKNYISGDAPIYIRITVKGKRSEVSTGRSCEPKRWSVKAGRVSGSKEDAKKLNCYLDDLRSKVYESHQSLTVSNEIITADSIKNKFLGKTNGNHTLMEAVMDHNDKMKSLIGKDYVQGTMNRFLVLGRHLETFIKSKYDCRDVDVKTVDQTFIDDFDFYLRSKKNCSNNYVVKNIKNLGKILRICLMKGWIPTDPLFYYKGKTKVVNRHYLTDDDIKKIQSKEFSTERLDQVRDVFLFCCFTGLAYVDVFNLRPINVKKGNDGEIWIFTNRQKTNTRSSIPLLPTAKYIIGKYTDHPVCNNRGFLLPVPSNQKMNEYLKEIAVLCGIEKKLTSHIARHTFSTTVTLSNGVPIESVSKMLGHTSIRTTQHYAKILDVKVGSDMALLKEKLIFK
jgi:site-specific recombinase XerD